MNLRRLLTGGALFLVVGGAGSQLASTSATPPGPKMPGDPTLLLCPRLGKPITGDLLAKSGLPDAVVPAGLVRDARLTGIRCATHSEYGVVGLTFMFTPLGQADGDIEVVLAADTPATESYIETRRDELDLVARQRDASVTSVDFSSLPARTLSEPIFVATYDDRPATKALMTSMRTDHEFISVERASWSQEALEMAAND